MITVIKHGKKVFKGFCSRCGCEFTYELEDVTLNNFVTCPDCGESCYIGGSKNTPYTPLAIGWPTPGEPIPCSPSEANKIDPCKDCDWMKKLLSGVTYIGDIPCTWCSKGPYRVTCDTVSGNGTTSTLSGLTYTYGTDSAINEYMFAVADSLNETNKAECTCSNSCLKRTELFSNTNCCCKDECAK